MPFADYIVTQWLLDIKAISDFFSTAITSHVGITGL